MNPDPTINWLIDAYRNRQTELENSPACLALIESLKDPSRMRELISEADIEFIDPLTPKEFGDFVVLGPVGVGGMGEVLRVRHKKLNRIQALKILPPHRVNNAQAKRRFEREMQAVGQLKHPNIVTVYDAGVVGQTPFLAMELIEGISLAQLVRDRKKSGASVEVHEAVEIIAQACRGIEHAHQNNVLHRDIKPANLMLDNDGTVKVLDLGLAKISSVDGTPTGDSPATLDSIQLTAEQQILGTPDFMAPEQISGVVDPRTDIYALGVTLYYLLTGQVLFPEANRSLIHKALAITNERAPLANKLRPEIPDYLNQAIAKSLSKDPNLRQQNAAEFIADLRLTSFTETISDQARDTIAEKADIKPKKSKASRLVPDSKSKTPSPVTQKRGVSPPINWIKACVLGLVPLALIWFSITFLFKGPDGTTLKVVCDDPNVVVQAEWIGDQANAPQMKTIDLKTGDATQLQLGGWRLAIKGTEVNKFELSKDKVELKRGIETVVEVSLIAGHKDSTETAANSNETKPPTPIAPAALITREAYVPPTAAQLEAYENIHQRTGLLPRNIIRPGLPLEGLYTVGNNNTATPGEGRRLPPPYVSPSGQYLVWISDSDGVLVKDIHNGKFVQFTPGTFREARWATSPSKGKEKDSFEPIEHLLLTPEYLDRPFEIRRPDGILVRSFKVQGGFVGDGRSVASQAIPIPNTQYTFLRTDQGAAIFNQNGAVGASIESAQFANMFAHDRRRCGEVAILKTIDESKPFKFLFTAKDNTIRSWQPQLQFDESEQPNTTSTVVEVNLGDRKPDGEIKDWFVWSEGRKNFAPGFITISPDQTKILLSSGGHINNNDAGTIILDPAGNRLASATISERFAFNPSSYLLVDGQGKIYDENLAEQAGGPVFEAKDIDQYPELIEFKKQPFWNTDSTIHLVTRYFVDGTLLLESGPDQKFRLTSNASAPAMTAINFSKSSELEVSTLFHPSLHRGSWRNRGYFATIKFDGELASKTSTARVGLHNHAIRSKANGGFLITENSIAFSLMSENEKRTFDSADYCSWSASGEQFVIAGHEGGKPNKFAFYDKNGVELHKIARHPRSISPHPKQNRWSNDERFFVEIAFASPNTEGDPFKKEIIPIVHDLQNGKEIELPPHRYGAPIDFSPDSKWLSIRRRYLTGERNKEKPNVTILNLETGKWTETRIAQGKLEIQTPPFCFSPRANEAVSLDGVYRIQPGGKLEKITSINTPPNKRWDIITVSQNKRASGQGEVAAIKVLLVDYHRTRQTYTWLSPGTEPILHTLTGRCLGHVVNSQVPDGDFAVLSNHNTFTLIPKSQGQPARFFRLFPDQSILSFDEFGQVDTAGLRGDINNYMIRTFNYSGGRVVPVNEADYLRRITATPDEKIVFWLNDLGITFKKVDGEIVEVIADNLPELSSSDLSVVCQLSHLRKLSITNCPLVKTLPLPSANWDTLTEVNVSETKFENAHQILEKCPNLESLDITGVDFPKLFVSNILNCKKLKTLRASHSLLTEAVAEKIRVELPNCKTVKVK